MHHPQHGALQHASPRTYRLAGWLAVCVCVCVLVLFLLSMSHRCSSAASWSRSCAAQVGKLLRDWHRVNVAMTRARAKLLLIGSASTMAGNPMLKSLLVFVEQRQWTIQLPVSIPHAAMLEPDAQHTTSLGRCR
jgi:AAA domain